VTSDARNAAREARLATLLAVLDGIELTVEERRVLGWLAEWETPTVTVIAGLLRRCRESGPQRGDR
jgi:hypothetical protein